MALRRGLPLLLLPALAGLSACGAGIIAGVFLGRQSDESPSPPVATITLSQSQGPLSIDADEFLVRRAVIRNASLPGDADTEVRMVADVDGVTVEDEQNVLVVERSGDETTVTFTLRTNQIAAAVGDVQARDVAAEVVVRSRAADETIVAEFAAPFLLLRQPTLTLVPTDPVAGLALVSVTGGEVEFSVTSLPTTDARDLVVEVVTGDPNPPPGQDPGVPAIRLRRASNLRTEPDPNDPDATSVRCTLPSSSFPTQAFARVVHVTAGRSTVVGGIYYHPELTAVVPRRGSTDGGEVVNLTGQGLVPLDFSFRPAEPDFAGVQLFVETGGIEVEVPAADLRPSLSSLNSLVFVTPPAPDGRPGPAAIRLQIFLPQGIDVEADDLFAYGAPATGFGPRGIALDGAAIIAADFAPRALDGAPSDPVDAAVVSADGSGVPSVELFESRGNGMFTRLGVPVVAGNRGDADQRDPLDVVWGDFDGDALRDAVVSCRGNTRSVHTLLRGQSDPSLPFHLAGVAFRSAQWPVRSHSGRFDAGPLDSALVVGSVEAQQTTILATPTGTGGFVTRPVFTQRVPLVEMSAVGDVDGDGHDDLVCASSGTGAELRLVFGDATTPFWDSRTVDLSGIPAVASSSVIGVGLAGPAPDRTVVIVTGGGAAVDPAIVLLPPASPRDYGATNLTVDLGSPGGPPTHALTTDLDADDLTELVLAREIEGLSLWGWDSGTFVELVDAVGLAAAETGAVRSLQAGNAVAGSSAARLAVFVAHEAPTSGGASSRLTTLLAGAGPSLVDPLARRPLAAAAGSVVVGAFAGSAGGGAPHDVLIAAAGRIDLLTNDGIGELEVRDTIAVAGLVPETLTGLPASSTVGVDRAAFVLADGRIGVIVAGSPVVTWSSEPLFDGLGTVLSKTRIAVGDVDADGFDDLAVLLVVERVSPAGEERTMLLVRGRDPAVDPFPFVIPALAARTLVEALAVDVALGDFAPDQSARFLEAALAVGRDDPERGLHFYRLQAGVAEDDWSFVVSIIDPTDARVAANLDPGLVLASDLEGDGSVDLIVVSGSYDLLQVFRQAGPSTRSPGPGEVDPEVFMPAGERVLPPGEPVFAHLVDVDGDGIEDVVVQTRRRDLLDAHTITVSVSSGLAGFVSGFEIPELDVGRFGPDLATAVGDLNGDGLADMVLAWSGDGGALPSQLRLLFGSHR